MGGRYARAHDTGGPLTSTKLAIVGLPTAAIAAALWLNAPIRVLDLPRLDPSLSALVAASFVAPAPPPPPPHPDAVVDLLPSEFYCPADERDAIARIDVQVTAPDGHRFQDTLHIRRCRSGESSGFSSTLADSVDPRSWISLSHSLDETTSTHGTYSMSASWKNAGESPGSYQAKARIRFAAEYVQRLEDGGEIRVRMTPISHQRPASRQDPLRHRSLGSSLCVVVRLARGNP